MSRKYNWPVLLEAQAKSGLSQAEFCRRNNVCAKYFSIKKSQAAKAEKAKGDAVKTGASSPFVRAVVPQPEPSPSMLTLSVGPVSVRFGSDTDPVYVARLAAALS